MRSCSILFKEAGDQINEHVTRLRSRGRGSGARGLAIASLRNTSFTLTRTLLSDSLDEFLVLRDLLELVQGLELHLLPEDVASKPVGQGREDLVVHVLSGWDGKDIVEFLESALLGLWHPEIDHDESCDVEGPMGLMQVRFVACDRGQVTKEMTYA